MESPLPLGLTVLMAVVLAPLAEEWLFRAGLYRFLKGRCSPWLAAIISASCFSFMHFNLASLLPLVVLALVLTYAYELSGSLRLPILVHAMFNANTMLILLLGK